MIDCGHGFRSIRGDFRVGGVVNVGTQCSLVKRTDGGFVFLDSYTLSDETRAAVDRLTDGGAAVEAIVNLHPFHTIHCEWMHRAFPQAKLYGTARHHEKWPDLPWEEGHCEAGELPALFGPDLEFSMPDGVSLVCQDEAVHFSSILAYHPASGTIHVDDTLSYLNAPFPLSLLPMTGRLDFHPTLAKALKPEAGAADAFERWAKDLAVDWYQAKRIAAAHNAILPLAHEQLPELVGAALGRAAPVLKRHRERYG
ncbi:hypothetical protein [Tsuneonella amylolytica]|uniref:hypothetical protein n=1 Tax=Tsuneonella amylolytica TaxID=2338327 RepID=UPI000EA921B8|nr:hypothetical protein [Tsuneonella amylolytica]